MDRRSLLDGDEAGAEENIDVFDDSFATEEDVDAVADGFRPGHNHDREEGDSAEQASSSNHHISEHYAPAASTLVSRNSTRKSRSHENPFASPEDGDAEQLLHRTPSGNFTATPDRSISPSSMNLFARSNSQRYGPGGPSHPYAMYPQGTMARTASVVTASTAGPPRQPTSPTSGPQHPYALYPQGVGDDLDDDSESVQNPVPIGFPGFQQTFRRQRGPDGEDRDIVGFYGHTEQLPPYTRYPDDGPEKEPLLGPPEEPLPLHSRAPVAGTDPSMPLMHTPIQPQPTQQSMTDESELTRQHSNTSGDPLVADSSSSRSRTTGKTSWKEKTWREKRETRVCGFPCWWFLVAVAVVLFALVVISGSVGGYYAGQAKAESHFKKLPTTTAYDASAIAATATTVAMPTGTFALNLGNAQEVQNNCLTNPAQRAAWGCNLVFPYELALNVQTPNGGNQSGASVYYVSKNADPGLSYGVQVSQMVTSFSPFVLVQDTDNPTWGSALFFKASYDKLVVIPETAMSAQTSSKTKRAVSDTGYYEGSPAGPSSRPWYCYFNDTLLEGFIYPDKRVAPLPASTSAPAWTSEITAKPSATITTTLTMATTTCTYTGAASAFPAWLKTNYPNFNMTKYLSKYPPSMAKKKRIRDDIGLDSLNGLSLYPYKIKLEERRLPGSPLPYCQQYQVLNDGTINWVPGPNGQPIVVQLTEKDPPFKPIEYPAHYNNKRSLSKRDEVPGACHCQWISGPED